MDVSRNHLLFVIMTGVLWYENLGATRVEGLERNSALRQSGAADSQDELSLGQPQTASAGRDALRKTVQRLGLPAQHPAVASLAPQVERTLSWQWHIRPHGIVYDTYWASATEPRLATHLVGEQHEGTLLDSHIGGRLGLVRFGPKRCPEGFQIDLLGGAKLRQDADDGLDVLATDYRYDILGTYGAGKHKFKVGFYHVSSHAGDELLLKHPEFHRLNFSRDTLVTGYSYYPISQLRIYAETGWAFDCEESEPWEFQFGLDFGPHDTTGIHGAPFLAVNVHLREELDFGGNFALQTGWAWRGEDTRDGVLRTGLYVYEGGSPQFSFYAEHEQQVGWGIWYDY